MRTRAWTTVGLVIVMAVMAAGCEARAAGQGVTWPTFEGGEMTDLTAYLQVGLSFSGPAPDRFDPGNPRRGQVLLATKGCTGCHALAGRGGRGARDLAEPGVWVRSVAEIAGVMWNHSAEMQPEIERLGLSPPIFRNGELTDLLAYLYFVSYASVEGRPQRGEQLFAEQCAPCHAPVDAAHPERPSSPDLLDRPALDDAIGIVTAMWNHAARMETQATRRNIAWPRLAIGQTADLAAYLVMRRRAAPAP